MVEGTGNTKTQAWIKIPYSVRKRTAPTVYLYIVVWDPAANTWATPDSVSVARNEDWGVSAYVTYTSGFTAIGRSGGGQIIAIADAEL